MAKRRRAKGSGSVYFRRADRRWIGDITLGGERFVRSGASKAEVTELLEALRRSAELGIGGKGTLAEWVAAWLAHPPTRLSERTMLGYESVMHKHILPRIGDVQLRQLTMLGIEAALDEMAELGLAPGTRHNALTALSSCLKSAVRQKRLAANPCAGVEIGDLARHRRRWPEIDPIRARQIMEAVTGHELLRDFVPLAFYTGLRISEILALDWVDVRPGARQLTVRRSLEMTRSGWQLGQMKTKNSWRTVPLTAEAVALLFGRRTRMGKPSSGLVFPTPRGKGEVKPWTPPAVDRAFKRALEAAGLEGYRPHDMRHAFASILLSNGAPLATVSRLLGHGQSSTTMAIYAHSLTGTDRRVVNDALQFWPDWSPGSRRRSKRPWPDVYGDGAELDETA